MNSPEKLKLGLLAAAVVTLVGCSGGGSSSNGGSQTSATTPTPPSTPATAVPPADVVRGTVTGFGSVFVNGKRFNTDDAEIENDGVRLREDDLAVGMVVTLLGDVGERRATTIKYEEDVKGPVDEVFADGSGLLVMGQVVLTADARFDDDLTLADFVMGDIIEVSGLRDENDAIRASYVERKLDVDEFEVRGRIRDLDVDADRFRIGRLEIDYSVARFDDVSESLLMNGLLVEVEGEPFGYTSGAFFLVATEVDGESIFEDDSGDGDSRDRDEDDVDGDAIDVDDGDDSDGDSDDRNDTDSDSDSDGSSDDGDSDDGDFDDGDSDDGDFDDGDSDDSDSDDRDSNGEDRRDVEIEGIVTAVLDESSFEVDGVRVELTDGTKLDDGSAGDIAVGVRLEVEGRLTLDDVIIADEIEFSEREARVQGIVEMVDPMSREVVVLGVTVFVDGRTELEDDSDADIEGFTLDDLMTGDFVQIRGLESAAGVRADELARDDVDETRLRGIALDVDPAAGILSILGVPVAIDAMTQLEREDDQIVGSEAFFDAIVEGQTIVEAKWTGSVTDPTVPVRELSLEDD